MATSIAPIDTEAPGPEPIATEPAPTEAIDRDRSRRPERQARTAGPPAARRVDPSANGDSGAGAQRDEPEGERGATGPQLRRFIKSRAYVPMHELRRRFAINGQDDEVTAMDVDGRRVYVGLPQREGRLLGELLHGGDIGFELSLDPISPIVVGVYPMRPVTRP